MRRHRTSSAGAGGLAACGALWTVRAGSCLVRASIGARAAAGWPPDGPAACPRCARVPCDARPPDPRSNSLRSLRSLRSDPARESDHVARCARGRALCASRLRPRAAGRPSRNGWAPAVARHRWATSGGLRGRGYPAGAIWGAPRSTGTGSARTPCALRDPTRRICPSAVNEVNAASYTARPCAEHRRSAGAQRRPLPHEPLPGIPCRDAPSSTRPRGRGSAMRRAPSSGFTPVGAVQPGRQSPALETFGRKGCPE